LWERVFLRSSVSGIWGLNLEYQSLWLLLSRFPVDRDHLRRSERVLGQKDQSNLTRSIGSKKICMPLETEIGFDNFVFAA
jgi:hypothetical protein